MWVAGAGVVASSEDADAFFGLPVHRHAEQEMPICCLAKVGLSCVHVPKVLLRQFIN